MGNPNLTCCISDWLGLGDRAPPWEDKMQFRHRKHLHTFSNPTHRRRKLRFPGPHHLARCANPSRACRSLICEASKAVCAHGVCVCFHWSEVSHNIFTCPLQGWVSHFSFSEAPIWCYDQQKARARLFGCVFSHGFKVHYLVMPPPPFFVGKQQVRSNNRGPHIQLQQTGNKTVFPPGRQRS